jgi:hypothetical protein
MENIERQENSTGEVANIRASYIPVSDVPAWANISQCFLPIPYKNTSLVWEILREVDPNAPDIHGNSYGPKVLCCIFCQEEGANVDPRKRNNGPGNALTHLEARHAQKYIKYKEERGQQTNELATDASAAETTSGPAKKRPKVQPPTDGSSQSKSPAGAGKSTTTGTSGKKQRQQMITLEQRTYALNSCWDILTDPIRSVNPEALQSYLRDDLGINDAQDLPYCEEDDMEKLIAMLKGPSKKRFIDMRAVWNK